MAEKIDIEEFARKVERMCDFFLVKLGEETEGSDSADVRVIQDIREVAADIHTVGIAPTQEALAGLDAYMRGHPETKEK